MPCKGKSFCAGVDLMWAGQAAPGKAPNEVKESRDSFIEKRPGVYTGT